MRSIRREWDQGGVVLVLVSAITAMLLILCLAMLQLGGSGVRGAAALALGAQEGLSAASGMEYAAAQLRAEGYPRFGRTLANRGDDWAYRDGPRVDLADARNPSYAHGEAWREDSAGADGVRETGEDVAVDLDGDGRHSAWSGRVRCGRDPFGGRFSLRIESEEGKIPLSVRPYDPGWGESYRVSLARVLGNLGATLCDAATGLPAIPARRWEVPTSGEPLLASWLGYDLVMGARIQPYRSWGEIAKTLALSPGHGDPDRETEMLRPYLDLGPYSLQRGRDGAYVPISFWTAPREVLRALWMYVMAETPLASGDWPGEPEGREKACPHSGLRFGEVQLILFPAEAQALANWAVRLRETTECRSWEGLRRFLSLAAPVLFREDFDALGEGPSTPRFQRSWVQAKANLAYQAVAMSPFPGLSACPSLAGWATGGLDADPDEPGFQPQPVVGSEDLHHVMYPKVFDPGTSLPWGYKGPTTPYRQSPRVPKGHPHGAPLGLTLEPPVRFSVVSLGVADARGRIGGGRCLEGRLRTRERLSFSTQEDFEGLVPSPGAPGSEVEREWGIRGIEAVSDPARALRRDAPYGHAPRVASLPRFAPWSGSGDPPSAACGALALGGIEDGIREAEMYWPFAEDFDGAPALYPPAGAPYELWSEVRPGFAPAIDWPGTGPPPYRFQCTKKGPYGCSAEKLHFPAASSAPALFGQLPGFDPYLTDYKSGVKGRGFVTGFTMEMWMAPGSSATIHCRGKSGKGISVRAVRGIEEGAPGTAFLLSVVSQQIGGRRKFYPYYWVSGTAPPLELEGFVPDPKDAPAWSYRVVLSVERLGNGHLGPADPDRTLFRLHVNGEELFSHEWIETSATYPYNQRVIAVQDCEGLRVEQVDEIRLYASARPPEGPEDRFVMAGLYTSPLYRLNRGARPVLAQWSGLLPPGFPKGSVRVRAVGYDAAGNVVGTVLLPGSGEVADLSASGLASPVRAIRYLVELDGGGATPLLDTPVFASIWLHLKTVRGAGWEAWGAR